MGETDVSGIATGRVRGRNRELAAGELGRVVIHRELPGVANAQSVLAEEVEALRDIRLQAAGVGIVRLQEAEALRVEYTIAAEESGIHDLRDVRRRCFREVVPAPGECAIDQ